MHCRLHRRDLHLRKPMRVELPFRRRPTGEIVVPSMVTVGLDVGLFILILVRGDAGCRTRPSLNDIAISCITLSSNRSTVPGMLLMISACDGGTARWR